MNSTLADEADQKQTRDDGYRWLEPIILAAPKARRFVWGGPSAQRTAQKQSLRRSQL